MVMPVVLMPIIPRVRRQRQPHGIVTVTLDKEYQSQQKLTNDMVVERIVRETSLSEGDVKNALVSLSNAISRAAIVVK